jgi:formate hydrogenlyase subunit 3/multisubunit Na+/H+ antiporter MnhD subunit|tara:strand:- start:126 stop:326 length:201 start_codon:yes stop_codon:yes gene_type:complete
MIKGVKENKINAFLRIIGALFLLIGLLIAYNTANTQLLTQISINFYAIAAILAIIGIIAIVAEYRN